MTCTACSCFAERPADAPVVHVRGPLTVSLYAAEQLTIGRQKQLALAVGTPGLGPGTTALVAYENFIPRDTHPRVEIEFPPEREGSPPVAERYIRVEGATPSDPRQFRRPGPGPRECPGKVSR